MDICELCNSERNLRRHHLTYVPEEIMLLCYFCHTILHMLSKIPEEKRIVITQTMLTLIKTYGSNWTNGIYNFQNLQYKRKYFKQWMKEHPNSGKESKKRWRKEHSKSINEYHKRWRKEHPNSIDKYNKRWRKEHPDSIKETNKRYYEKHRKHKINFPPDK